MIVGFFVSKGWAKETEKAEAEKNKIQEKKEEWKKMNEVKKEEFIELGKSFCILYEMSFPYVTE